MFARRCRAPLGFGGCSRTESIDVHCIVCRMLLIRYFVLRFGSLLFRIQGELSIKQEEQKIETKLDAVISWESMVIPKIEARDGV